MDLHNWCMNVSTMAMQVQEKPQFYEELSNFSICIDPNFPFMELSVQQMNAIVQQLLQNQYLSCVFELLKV
jgi:hypothetical protein